jgi:hypothetical protein
LSFVILDEYCPVTTVLLLLIILILWKF